MENVSVNKAPDVFSRVFPVILIIFTLARQSWPKALS